MSPSVSQPQPLSVDLSKIKEAVAGLDHDLLTLEATGDYNGTKKLMSEMMVLRPEVQRALERLKGVPTDIEPVFVTADAVTPAKMASKKAAKKK